MCKNCEYSMMKTENELCYFPYACRPNILKNATPLAYTRMLYAYTRVLACAPQTFHWSALKQSRVAFLPHSSHLLGLFGFFAQTSPSHQKNSRAVEWSPA